MPTMQHQMKHGRTKILMATPFRRIGVLDTWLSFVPELISNFLEMNRLIHRRSSPPNPHVPKQPKW